jgi:phosphohistidine phosphatase
MAPAFDCERVQIQEELYETHVGGVQRMINALDSEISTVMFVGHEPTASATAAYLAGSGSDGPSLKAVALGLRTGTAAVLETDVSWADVGRGDARLVGVYSGRAEY